MVPLTTDLTDHLAYKTVPHLLHPTCIIQPYALFGCFAFEKVVFLDPWSNDVLETLTDHRND